MKHGTFFQHCFFYAVCAAFFTGCGGGGGGGSAQPLPELSQPTRQVSSEFAGYALNNINARAAHERNWLGQGVTVGVIDSGMLTLHEELSLNAVSGYNELEKSSNIYEPISSINRRGHGTAVGGVIAAAENGRGIVGVAPRAKLLPLQIGNAYGQFLGNHVSLIAWAMQRNTPIINNSWGYSRSVVGSFRGRNYQFSMPFGVFGGSEIRSNEYDAMVNVVRGKDTVLVWAAGNSGWHSGGSVWLCASGFDNCLNPVYNCTANCGMYATPEDIIANFNSVSHRSTVPYTISSPTLSNLNTQLTPNIPSLGRLSSYNITMSGPSFLERAPLYHSDIMKNWLVVAATDSNNQIARFSNGCGATKMWCLAAPGVSVTTSQAFANSLSETAYGRWSGTSFSAPYVSGALAVLRGRMPAMPMETIRAILLQSATDLGARGIDDTYGWGLVNLSTALRMQSRISSSGVSQAVLSGNKKIILPSLFAGAYHQFNNVQVAVSTFNGLHYNVPLGKLMRVSDSRPSDNPMLPAANMLARPQSWRNGFLFADVAQDTHHVGAVADAGAFGNWRLAYCHKCNDKVWRGWELRQARHGWNSAARSAPFFAAENQSALLQKESGSVRPFVMHGKDYLQYGAALHAGEDSPLHLLAEVSRIDEKETMWGWRADFGGGMRGGSEQLRLGMQAALSEKWQSFADYETARGTATTTANNVLRSFSDLRAAGWSAGMDGRNLIVHGDNMRFSARRPVSIVGGQAIFEHRAVSGDFTEAFYRQAHGKGGGQEVYVKQTAVDLSQSTSPLLLRLGYSRPFALSGAAAHIAVAAEHESGGGAAFSIGAEMEF